MRLEQDVPLDGLTEKLNNTMPVGIRVTHIEQVMDERAPALQTQVVSAEYRVTSKESGFGSDLKRKIDSVMESESIPRTRRNKEYDLRPLIENLELTSENELVMRLTAKEGATGRPEEVLDVLGIAFEETHIERTRLNFKK
jgi:radical SAM-linked protein